MNKHHKTRVAVLLRGQLRHAQLGGQLYKRAVQDRFWDVDFRVSAGSWDTTTDTMSTIQSDRILIREVNTVRLKEPIGELLSSWGPGHIRKCRTSELMLLCHRLFQTVQRYTGMSDYWDVDASSYGIAFPLGGDLAGAFSRDIVDDIVLSDDSKLRSSGTDVFVNNVRLELLQLHYVLGQIWSMGEAYNSYVEWKSLNPDWEPDIIWCTRPDSFTWFPDNVWNKMKLDLKNHGGIHTSMVGIQAGRPCISDYNFFATPAELEHFGNITDNLMDAWTNRPELLLNLIGSGGNLQHQLWSIVFRNTNIHQLKPSLCPLVENVLRPVEGLESAVTEALIDPSAVNMRLLQDFVSTGYTYPVPNVPADAVSISNSWNDVMSD